ncbi:MAG: tetratricopeptide repeat protein [Bdellovibrionales bacterium]|nr:tetratricopeptide repeat protein [Bdellovibrionales bacterium]
MVEIYSEKQREAEDLCNQGIELSKQGDHAQAHKLFTQALAIDPESAKIQSWFGFTTGIVENYVTKGLEYCKRAVASDIPDVMFFRNLGKK